MWATRDHWGLLQRRHRAGGNGQRVRQRTHRLLKGREREDVDRLAVLYPSLQQRPVPRQVGAGEDEGHVLRLHPCQAREDELDLVD
eukprot:9857355-Prorocentrum_lima.AAC.1